MLLLLAALPATPCALLGQDAELQGSWQPDAYVMADGTRHDVDGRIYFVGSDWSVLFFVTADGEPMRGSAEGGTFETSGDALVFRHNYHLSAGAAMEGLPESPLRMNLVSDAEAAVEASRYEIAGDRLTIFFPSGNRMEFGRSGTLRP